MLHDISPPLSPKLAVWPGDIPLSPELGANASASALRTTAHLGAHADAPSHYGAGPNIDAQPLDLYLGPCHVIHVHVPRGGLVTPELLRTRPQAPRVLVATGTYPDPENFNADFAGLVPDLIAWLAEQGVRLIGIDTPSVDPLAATELPTHRACGDHGIAILEGLVLREVPNGLYELIALPLRLVGFDGSPVRAVLRPLT